MKKIFTWPGCTSSPGSYSPAGSTGTCGTDEQKNPLASADAVNENQIMSEALNYRAETGQFDRLLVVGPAIHAVEFGRLEILSHAAIEVDLTSGEIVTINSECDTATSCNSSSKTLTYRLKEGEFLCPGLIDTHHHAPQTSNLGLGLDYTLLEWLERVTFPREQSYGSRSDDEIRQEYRDMARRLLRGGTTTCVYFGSLQLHANQLLADELAASGQRAFVGKVCMNQNAPAGYVESTEDSVHGTLALIDHVKRLGNDRIQPIVTPRFAPTCSQDLLAQLGTIAHKHNCHVQTHVSENESEIAWVRELFPASPHYTAVYDAARLLTSKTILAHAIHLEEEEKELIRERNAAISHCPNSNFALSSGCLDVRDLLQRGIKVSLGTDVSGGYSTSMLDACRQAITASKTIHFARRHDRMPLTAAEAFSLATIGGAAALDMADRLGSFAVGKLFDALIVNVAAHPQIPLCPRFMREAAQQDALQCLFEKFVFCGDDRCIQTVFVSGTPVWQAGKNE